MKNLKSVILLLCLSATLAFSVSAISIRGLLGLDDEKDKAAESVDKDVPATKQATTSPNWAKAKAANPDNVLDLEQVKRLLRNLEAGQSTALLADEAAFKQFIEQEAGNMSVIAAARVNKLDEDVNTAFLMQRGAENILREIYLAKLINEKIPADFPTAEQLQEYYDKNKDKFVIEERVHVWQIFLPLSEDMDAGAVAALEKQANAIAEDIRKNKINFGDAAVKYSKHLPSNSNGGYMGLIKTAELKPDIQKVVLALEEGKISKALKTDSGMHIVKRGAIVTERMVSLEEGREQISKLLSSQVRKQLRQAIFEQAALSYPVELSDNKIEEWRLRLRTNVTPKP